MHVIYIFQIQFTYERDDGHVTSWVDHVLCSNRTLTIVSVSVSVDDVVGAINLIKPHKVDSAHLSTEHLKHSALTIAGPLSAFFTAVLCHGYMPKCIRDCTLVPIPKNNKDPSSSKFTLQSDCNCFSFE